MNRVNGVSRAGDIGLDAQTAGNPANEGRLATSQVALQGKGAIIWKGLGELQPDGFRLFRGTGHQAVLQIIENGQPTKFSGIRRIQTIEFKLKKAWKKMGTFRLPDNSLRTPD